MAETRKEGMKKARAQLKSQKDDLQRKRCVSFE